MRNQILTPSLFSHSDFADQHPHAEVIGTDISPIQASWLPPNLRFEMDDATLEWTFRPDTFDFIHMRYLFGSVADWPALYRQAFLCCKPGGYLEDFEASVVITSDDGTVTDGSPMHQWGKVFHEAGNKFGRTFRVLEDEVQKKEMEAVGFTNVTVWDFKVSPLYPPPFSPLLPLCLSLFFSPSQAAFVAAGTAWCAD